MARAAQTPTERNLLKKLRLFLKEPSQHGVLLALSEWKQKGWQPYLFGGLLRDILILGRRQRPRDIDVVITGGESEDFAAGVLPYIRHRNRFGGFRLELSKWQMDVWSLEKTWAFQHFRNLDPRPQNLPRTTFLNVEAIAVSIEEGAEPGKIYEHNFFHAISVRTIDINFEDNPYPELAAVRALSTAIRIRFALSPRLGKYILNIEKRVGSSRLVAAQETHYGYVRFRKQDLNSLIRYIGTNLEENPNSSVSFLPLRGEQLSLPLIGA